LTSFLDRIPLDRIGEQAQQIKLTRVLLYLLSFPFIVVGVTARVLFFMVKWSFAAVVIGWQEAGKALERGPAG
jgi:hypothetical protein